MKDKPRILLVDDDKFATDFISKRLENSGFRVSSVNKAEDALGEIKDNTPELIILDLLMPGMDGYELFGRIRANKNYKNIPVIILTASLAQADKIKGLKMGADDYITKPYDSSELVARIKTVLKRYKAQGGSKKIKNILVTGGAGFIGAVLVKRLLKDGNKVAVIDDFSTGSQENLKDVIKDKNFKLITGSITDEAIVAKAVEECDLIYHLAATVGVKNVVDKPLETIIYDTIGTSIILKYASAKGVKTVLTSTSEVYGKSEKFPFKEDEDVVIGPPDVNRWSYACSKLLDEFFAVGYHRERGLPVVIIRLFNVVGPGQLGRYGMVIPRFFKMALANKPITVYGNGEQIRCFTYIDDAVDIIIKLAQTDASNGEVINLGSENQISIKELAAKIKRITKSRSKIVFEPYRKYYGAHFQDIRKRVPDLSKLKKIAKITPRTSLDEILEKTNRYFERYPKELDRI